MKYDLTLTKINNTNFSQLYKQFIVGTKLTAKEYKTILAIAICFINAKDKSVQHLGYRIIVDFCNQTGDYEPLYEISINIGLYPISKYIEENYISDDKKNFFTTWNDSFMEKYKHNNIYQSEQQKALTDFFSDHTKETVSIVAPTSYGKSDLINNIVRSFPGKKICILVPTKALLMQTKKRIKVASEDRFKKIVIHPEMYNSDEDTCLAVLTQERLLRLFKNDPNLAFDCIVIDEAHELLENVSRSKVLAYVIIFAQKRNPKVAIKFLTPFISEPNNLKVRYTSYNIESFKVSEYIKTEKYFIHDLKYDNKSFLYDQFLNKFYVIKDFEREVCEEEVIKEESGNKNIIYLNRPQDIESFALALAEILPEVNSEIVDIACKNISDYMNPQYNLIKCLRKGVIYHHGSVPDAVRLYIEDLYKNVPEIKYVVTSSTLLEGVNLPAERMFILDNKRGRANLSPESFHNLVGRVCRFNDIFDGQNSTLKRLEPQIHIVYGKYFSERSDVWKFIQHVAKINTSLSDSVENVLLQGSTIDDSSKENELDRATEFIENYEKGTVHEYHERYTKTEVGQFCIMNGVDEIDVFEKEEQMQSVIDQYKTHNYIISDTDELLQAIWYVFLQYVPDKNEYELKRLKNSEARDFYSMIFRWRIENKSYSEMINLFVDYWRYLYRIDHNVIVYVGKWGDIFYTGQHVKRYTYIKGKTYPQLVNIAIVRIKEEQDFIDNSLIKYVETLKDLNLLEEHFYLQIKYGTDDANTICLLKNGFSLSLSILLLEKYRSYLDIDIFASTVHIDEQLLDAMSQNQENKILIQEVQSCI